MARIIYKNYRGEIAERVIDPKFLWFGVTEYHPTPQTFVRAWDHDKQAMRDFATCDILEVLEPRGQIMQQCDGH